MEENGAKYLAFAAAGVAAISAVDAAAQTLAPSGPKTTGSSGPGKPSEGRFRIERTGLIEENVTFGTFGCTVFKDNSGTPDWMTANIYFERDVRNGDLRMPDGKKVRYWTFEDPLRKSGPQTVLPAPLIRVQQDDLAHVRLKARKGSHTIHHHGIEPTTMNDGVGHVSMEITSTYIYQWQPRHPGTYFYHCHKNTITHFEMGLFGMLVVDPKPDDNGVVRAFTNGPTYDVEALWAIDDFDPRWHNITDADEDIGLCGDDSGLNIFRPKYFLISGTPTKPNVETVKQSVKAAPGQKILIRLLNASYSLLAVTFHEWQVEVVSVDGRALNQPWNESVVIPAGETIYLSTAQRYDIIIDTTSRANAGKRGKFPVTFEFQDWISRRRQNEGDATYEGYAFTTITV
jgi:FtsP/CotA-like multicopper oxidase with cupredoxin domain